MAATAGQSCAWAEHEGQSGHAAHRRRNCPHCGAETEWDDAIPFGMHMCRKCHTVLWVLTLNGRALFFPRHHANFVGQLWERRGRDEAFAVLVSAKESDVAQILLRFDDVADEFESLLWDCASD